MESVQRPPLRKSLNRITFPKIPPYNTVDDYLTSKFFLHGFIFNEHKADRVRQEPSVDLVVSQRAYKKTKQLLEKRRLLAKQQRASLNEQWQEVKEKEQELKNTFAQMNTFVISNKEKRARAILRLKEDSILRKEREKEVEKLKGLQVVLKEAKTEMEEKVNSYGLYERYLDDVLGSSNEFRNPDELLGRFETLYGTRAFLAERQASAMKQIEKAKGLTLRMTEENTLVIMGLNTKVADLRSGYTMAHRKCLHWEEVVSMIKTFIFRRAIEIAETKTCCRNLYINMCERKRETPKLAEDDFEGQLLYIKNVLRVLKAVNKHKKK